MSGITPMIPIPSHGSLHSACAGSLLFLTAGVEHRAEGRVHAVAEISDIHSELCASLRNDEKAMLNQPAHPRAFRSGEVGTELCLHPQPGHGELSGTA